MVAVESTVLGVGSSPQRKMLSRYGGAADLWNSSQGFWLGLYGALPFSYALIISTEAVTGSSGHRGWMGQIL